MGSGKVVPPVETRDHSCPWKEAAYRQMEQINLRRAFKPCFNVGSLLSLQRILSSFPSVLIGNPAIFNAFWIPGQARNDGKNAFKLRFFRKIGCSTILGMNTLSKVSLLFTRRRFFPFACLDIGRNGPKIQPGMDKPSGIPVRMQVKPERINPVVFQADVRKENHRSRGLWGWKRDKGSHVRKDFKIIPDNY
jgi:hypothetical protein